MSELVTACRSNVYGAVCGGILRVVKWEDILDTEESKTLIQTLLDSKLISDCTNVYLNENGKFDGIYIRPLKNTFPAWERTANRSIYGVSPS